jgi:signal transduction histidine kinase
LLTRLLVVALPVLACATTPPSGLKIGYGHVSPISFRDAQGKPAGFAVDVLIEAARRAGIHLSWTPVGGSLDIENALSDGRLDLVAAGMITPERRRKFFVSAPWWFLEMSVIALDRAGVRSESELGGKRLGLSSPIYGLPAAQQYPLAVLVPFDSTDPATAALCRGEVAAILVSHGDMHDLFRTRPESCRGVELHSFDSRVVAELAVMARPPVAAKAGELRARIDEMALDGTLARLAGQYPNIPALGAVRLAESVRARYSSRVWINTLVCLVVLLAAGGFFLAVERRTSRKLRHERELLVRVFDKIPVMIAVADARTGKCRVNSEFERVLGWRAAERSQIDWLPPGPPESEWRDVKVSGAEGSPVDTSWAKVVLSDGTEVAIGIDLRERLRAAQAIHEAERLESLGWLAGGIAHDFNNILTIVSGNVSLVADDPDIRPDVRSGLQSVLEACTRANALTVQLLSYAGKASRVRQPISLSDEASEVIQILAPAGNRIAVHAELASDLPPILADQAQIRQVFRNLILNSIEAIDESRAGRVTVRVDRHDDQSVLIEITDDGCGMDPRTVQRMFDPFFTTKFLGRGLGLAAVRGIVHSLGGQITVESERGRGTTVRILLPVEPVPGPVPTARPV